MTRRLPAYAALVLALAACETGSERKPAVSVRLRTTPADTLAAGDSEVQGEGVVGQEPLIAPGGVHEYQSFCVLRGPEGHMEGYYVMERPDGATFQAAIPRFLLRRNQA